MKFLEKLRTFDRDNIPEKVLQKVKALTKSPDFNIERMLKASKAAGGLAKWCKAIREYGESILIVRPLQQKQAQMKAELREAQEAVAVKQQEVAEIKGKLSQLEDDYQSTLEYIQSLKRQKQQCEQRLANASKLLDLLGSEGERWRAGIRSIKGELKKVIGNVFLSASQMSYLGPFTGQYREPILADWIKQSLASGIQLSGNYSLLATLGDPVEIREWGICGLPSDAVSIENAIFTTKSQRVPMLIDPQFQGNGWLKKMFRRNPAQQFAVEKVGRKDEEGGKRGRSFQATLENAVRFGHVLLLEDMSEELDPSVDQIVSKATYLENGVPKIVLGSRTLDFDSNFRLFLTTKLANPHFLPEVSIKLAVVNFTVTFDGLDDQLLAEVVQNLEPEVERTRDQLIIEISGIKNQQFEVQSSILTALAESNADTILDNEPLIAALQISKTKSVEIADSLLRSEEVERTVQSKREQYRPISVRGSILYFVIASLAAIDPMYQNSLAYVKKIFNDTIKQVVRAKLPQAAALEESASVDEAEGAAVEASGQPPTGPPTPELASGRDSDGRGDGLEVDDADRSQKSEVPPIDLGDIPSLLAELLEKISWNLYVSVCRGLFEQHKIIFSFLISVSINKNAKVIDEASYSLLLKGPGVYDKAGQPDYQAHKRLHGVISEQQWDLACCMQLRVRQHFPDLLESLSSLAHPLVGSASGAAGSVLDSLPEQLRVGRPLFHQLLLVKLLRPTQIMQAIKEYVARDLDPRYTTSPVTTMDELFGSADRVTPVIFVLSQGADPIEQILGFARKQQFQDKIFQKSLGQGQERAAAALVEEGSARGYWILLQNCHLFKSWMPQLEAICSSLRENPRGVHPDFRLILTSMPEDYFPASILQNGVKMTTEPPQGLKANLRRIFTNIVDRDVLASAQVSVEEAARYRDSNAERPEWAAATQQAALSKSSDFSGATRRSAAAMTLRPSMLPDFERRFDLVRSWQALLFGLSFFHSIVQERKKFGSIGWNKRYEFNDSDLATSVKMLQNFIFESEDIPFDSMEFMTGHINYGGRVTDDNDRILLMCLLKNCFGEVILEPSVFHVSASPAKRKQALKKKQAERKEDFCFFGSQLYRVPNCSSTEDIQAYIAGLPDEDSPEIFGMHPNANIACQQSETAHMVRTILGVHIAPVVSKTSAKRSAPEDVSSHSGSLVKGSKAEVQEAPADPVLEVARKLFEGRPEAFSDDPRDHNKEIFRASNSEGLLHCFSIVFLQEKERYNRLIRKVAASLEQLIRAIQGLVLMSPELDSMYQSILRNQVPDNWQSVSYSSLKSLASWYHDLHDRVAFIR
jgi:dynein heavy chain, axonemal